jgi:predicted nucleic acid-binding protein
VILVDTSVWVDHFRSGSPRLAAFLTEGKVLTHPFVIGELACGNLRRRREVLATLESLPAAPVAAHREVLRLVEEKMLAGRGIGWIDMHLVAAALLAGATLWTRDGRLAAVAGELGAG